MIFLIHLGDKTRRRFEGLAGHCDDHLVHIRGLGFLDRLFPHMDADVSCFHRIIGQWFASTG